MNTSESSERPITSTPKHPGTPKRELCPLRKLLSRRERGERHAPAGCTTKAVLQTIPDCRHPRSVTRRDSAGGFQARSLLLPPPRPPLTWAHTKSPMEGAREAEPKLSREKPAPRVTLPRSAAPDGRAGLGARHGQVCGGHPHPGSCLVPHLRVPAAVARLGPEEAGGLRARSPACGPVQRSPTVMPHVEEELPQGKPRRASLCRHEGQGHPHSRS